MAELKQMLSIATQLRNNTVFAFVSFFLLGFGCPLTKLRGGEGRSWTRKVICIVGKSLWPGLRDWLTKKISFFFWVRGGGGRGTPGVVILPIEPQKPVHSGVLQCIVRCGVGVLAIEITVLDICLHLPGTFILYKFLIVISSIKPQSVLGRVFSFCDKIQGIVRAGLSTSPAAMVVRPRLPLVKMVDPSPSPFTHWRLPDFDVVIASIVNDIVWKLDLLGPGLRLGSSEYWQMYWFFFRRDFLWTQFWA